jgi:hypothetical protein
MDAGVSLFDDLWGVENEDFLAFGGVGRGLEEKAIGEDDVLEIVVMP